MTIIPKFRSTSEAQDVGNTTELLLPPPLDSSNILLPLHEFIPQHDHMLFNRIIANDVDHHFDMFNLGH